VIAVAFSNLPHRGGAQQLRSLLAMIQAGEPYSLFAA